MPMLGAEGLATGGGGSSTCWTPGSAPASAPEAPLGAEHQNAKKGFSSQDSPLPKNKNQITRKLNPEACEKGTPAARPSPCQEGKVVCFCNIQKQSM